MSDQHGNTTDDAMHQRGAWFVYHEDEHDGIVYPLGVYGELDALDALVCASREQARCVWWPYGWEFERAVHEWCHQ